MSPFIYHSRYSNWFIFKTAAPHPSVTHIMPYRKRGYVPRYLRDFKRKRRKTWDKLDRECSRRDKIHAERMAREEQAFLEEEERNKATLVALKARSARLEARNYQPEPSPEPQWVIVRP